MNHQRHVIREAIVAALVAASTAASTRVYDTPSDPRAVFPALTVIDDGEDQQVVSTMGGGFASRIVERTLRIVVTAEVQQNANYARQRDQLLADVEATMASYPFSGVKSITPGGYQADTTFVGERPIAQGHQRFDVVYLTTQGDPTSTF